MKSILMALVALLLCIAVATAATYPVWVVNSAPATGFVKCYKTTVLDRRLSTIELTTSSAAVSFSVWNYDPNRSPAWKKLAPLWGRVAGDTLIIVPPNTTKAWTFPERVDGIYKFAGTGGYWSGE